MNACSEKRDVKLFHIAHYSNFPTSFIRNITSYSMENVVFHSFLGWITIILHFSQHHTMHFSFKGWENVTFWSWEWKEHQSCIPRLGSWRLIWMSTIWTLVKAHSCKYYKRDGHSCENTRRQWRSYWAKTSLFWVWLSSRETRTA